MKGKQGEPGTPGKDGQDGQPGADGKDGADGHTPVIGEDYFTDADIQEITNTIKKESVVLEKILTEPVNTIQLNNIDILKDGGHYEVELISFTDTNDEISILINNLSAGYYDTSINVSDNNNNTHSITPKGKYQDNVNEISNSLYTSDQNAYPNITKCEFWLTKNSTEKYMLSYSVKHSCALSGRHSIVDISGVYQLPLDNLTSITFNLNIGNFLKNTKVIIKKVNGEVLGKRVEDYLDGYSNKKMNCLGDSITWGYIPDVGTQMENPYPKLLKERLGLAECRNYGISGSTLCQSAYSPMSVRFLDMNDDADIISVFGGTNDQGVGFELGKIEDTENSTIYGSLDILCKGLIEKYPQAFIFFITPLRNGNAKINSKGYSLEDVANAIKEVCYKYSIPVLDLYSIGGFHIENDNFREMYNGEDKLHPNQKFMNEHLAPIIEQFIRSRGNNSYTPQNELNKKIDEILNPKWEKLSLLNGWENWGGTYPPAQYTKIGSHIYLQGLIKRGSGNNGYAGILPEGYRPSKSIKYIFTNNNDKFMSGYVEPNGNIAFANITNNTWIDLSAINFFTGEYEEPVMVASDEDISTLEESDIFTGVHQY